MTTIQINPVPIVTRGGYHGEITGIQNDHDLLSGWVDTPGAGKINVRWNGSGIARDKSEDCNIAVHDDAIAEAIKDAEALFKK